MKIKSLAVWVSFLAFLMDGGTGLLLIFAPTFTMQLMGLDPAEAPAAYLRFIGAFVFAVGILYGVAWRAFIAERFVEWSVVWIATAWVRLCVGCTVLGMIISGTLAVAWSSVPAADLSLGIFQFWYLLRAKYINE